MNELTNPVTKHPLHRVTSFAIQGPFTLRVSFDDDTSQMIDFSPILEGELYSPLRDLTFFNQVKVDPEVHTLVWPNGADFDPATLYDWPVHVEAMKAMARRWATGPREATTQRRDRS